VSHEEASNIACEVRQELAGEVQCLLVELLFFFHMPQMSFTTLVIQLMVRVKPAGDVPSCAISFEAGKLTARRIMSLIIAREQQTQSLLRPRLAQLLVQGRSAGIGNRELMANLLTLIRAYLLSDRLP